MKKNKTIYVHILAIIGIFCISISCQKNDINNGILYATYKSSVDFEDSETMAKDIIYKELSVYMSDLIERDDYVVIKAILNDNSIIDFETAKIKKKRNNKTFTTKIIVNDKTLIERSLLLLEGLRREGNIQGSYRSYADIEIPQTATLNAYTRAMLERNALDRARESLYNTLIKDGLSSDKAAIFTNNAFIIEETQISNIYSVVIEVPVD